MNKREIEFTNINSKLNKNNKIYYVYRHVRNDNGEVFYIGVGTKNLSGKRDETVYPRGFQSKNGRSLDWLSVASQTSFTVEIVSENLSIDENFNKEIELIKLYGRADLGEGTLVNHDDGGRIFFLGREDTGERFFTESYKQQRRDEMLSRGWFGARHPGAKDVFVYDRDGNFYKKFLTGLEAAEELNIPNGVISYHLDKDSGKNGFFFRSQDQGGFIDAKIKPHPRQKAVLCFSEDGNFIREFASMQEVYFAHNIFPSVLKTMLEFGGFRNGICFISKDVFEKPPVSEEEIKRHIKEVNQKARRRGNSIKVDSYDLDLSLIESFPSIGEASKQKEISHKAIKKAAQNFGKLLAGGLYWKFA